MNEIKFRAWSYDHNKYFYNGENESIFQCCSIVQILKAIPAKIGYDIKITNSFNGVLEQYTGRKDKNDRKIYDGDIVYSQSRGTYLHIFIGEEKYLGCGVTLCGVCSRNISTEKKELFMYESGSYDWEIVGNIHEGFK